MIPVSLLWILTFLGLYFASLFTPPWLQRVDTQNHSGKEMETVDTKHTVFKTFSSTHLETFQNSFEERCFSKDLSTWPPLNQEESNLDSGHPNQSARS